MKELSEDFKQIRDNLIERFNNTKDINVIDDGNCLLNAVAIGLFDKIYNNEIKINPVNNVLLQLAIAAEILEENATLEDFFSKIKQQCEQAGQDKNVITTFQSTFAFLLRLLVGELRRSSEPIFKTTRNDEYNHLLNCLHMDFYNFINRKYKIDNDAERNDVLSGQLLGLFDATYERLHEEIKRELGESRNISQLITADRDTFDKVAEKILNKWWTTGDGAHSGYEIFCDALEQDTVWLGHYELNYLAKYFVVNFDIYSYRNSAGPLPAVFFTGMHLPRVDVENLGLEEDQLKDLELKFELIKDYRSPILQFVQLRPEQVNIYLANYRKDLPDPIINLLKTIAEHYVSRPATITLANFNSVHWHYRQDPRSQLALQSQYATSAEVKKIRQQLTAKFYKFTADESIISSIANNKILLRILLGTGLLLITTGIVLLLTVSMPGGIIAAAIGVSMIAVATCLVHDEKPASQKTINNIRTEKFAGKASDTAQNNPQQKFSYAPSVPITQNTAGADAYQMLWKSCEQPKQTDLPESHTDTGQSPNNLAPT